MLNLRILPTLLFVTFVTADHHHRQAGQPVCPHDLIDANTRFGLDTYKQLAIKDGNVFFSPYSLSVILGMLYEGSNGDTVKEIGLTAYFDQVQNLPTAYHELINLLNSKSSDYLLLSANRIYTVETYNKVLQNYLHLIRDKFVSDIIPTDFAQNPEAARQKINHWVEQMTNDKIKNLIPPGVLTPITAMVLVNALYFKADWQYKFKVEDTTVSTFHLGSTKGDINTPMMHQRVKLKVIHCNHYRVLELPYKGRKLSMHIVLPYDVDGLAGVENMMTYAELQNIQSMMQSQIATTVDVSLPKFKVEDIYTMNSYLSAMGIHDLFIPGVCDLSRIDGTLLLYVSKIYHQSFIEVNEEGSEAASASGAVVTYRGRPYQFRADHPFLFYIKDNVCGSILFMGRIQRPLL